MSRGITKWVMASTLLVCALIACTPVTQSQNNSSSEMSAKSYMSFWWPFSNHDLWTQFRRDSRVTDASRIPAVRKHIERYMRNKTDLKHTITKSRPYMYYIYQETQRRRLPVELALIPIIESDFNPFDRSYKGAAGLWQLMPEMARDYGVKRNSTYDGRRDIVASTNAALDHFTYLNNYFNGDLLLAVAAYDTGHGRVKRAMEKNAQYGMETNFWSLHLPQETRDYVPKLLALATIVNNPEKYGVDLPPIKNEPYLTQIEVDGAVDLERAAKLADMSPAQIRLLNPGYNHWKLEPSQDGHHLILPIDNAAIFKQRLKELHDGRPVQIVQHQPTNPNEPKSAYAKAVSIDTGGAAATQAKPIAIAELTPPPETDIVANNPLQQIYISNRTSANTTPAVPSVQLAKATATTDAPHVKVSVSQRSSVTRNETVKVTQKSEKNKSLASHDKTKHGGELIKVTRQTKPTYYRVKSGDSLQRIARKNGVSVALLKQWNGLKGDAGLKRGKNIIIRRA